MNFVVFSAVLTTCFDPLENSENTECTELFAKFARFCLQNRTKRAQKTQKTNGWQLGWEGKRAKTINNRFHEACNENEKLKARVHRVTRNDYIFGRVGQVLSPATSFSEREVLFATRRSYTPSLTQYFTQTKKEIRKGHLP